MASMLAEEAWGVELQVLLLRLFTCSYILLLRQGQQKT